MAKPVDQGQNTEIVCQVEESHQEQPKPNSSRPVAEKRQVGFDCEFVERPPKVLQADCPVCLLVLREPHQVTCCGYGFCRVCIKRIEAYKKPCPTCNRKDFSVFPDVRLQRSLYEFHVWCSHKTEGCEWRGELSQLEKHLNESPKLHEQLIGCEFVKVGCHHCCKLFQRRYISVHQIDECIRRPFSCEFCGNYGADFEDVTLKHWPVCVFYPVPCPSKCGVCPERQNLECHVNKDCPLTVINCEFYYAGCEVQLPRKDIPAHLAESLVAHTSLMASYNQSKAQEKDQQIAQLTKDLRENKQSIIQLEKENEILKQALLEKTNKIAQLQQSQDDLEAGLNKELTQLKANKQEITQLKTNTATKQELAQLKGKAVSKEDYEATKQELVQLRSKQGEDRSSLRTLQSFIGFPFEFTMTGFEKHKRADDRWYSEPFYTHLHGYKLCLSVDANGWGEGNGTHVSVGVYLMPGEFDNTLRWPFQGDITMQMINELKDKEHQAAIIHFSQADMAKDARQISRVTTGERAKFGRGESKFLSHIKLGYNRAKNCQFLKDDCLRFRVTQITNVCTAPKIES